MKNKALITTASLLLLALLYPPLLCAQTASKQSSFGQYAGYSKPNYDGWIRQSQYVKARDGTRLALDIIRPSRNGKVATKSLPVLITFTPYHRAFYHEGKIASIVEDLEIQTLIKHGYILVDVDIRGTGASFDAYQGFLNPKETRDSYDMIEWVAKQPWSNGKVGMIGGSYQGLTQLMVAAQKPPHLKAIFPEVTGFDIYNLFYLGGVFRVSLINYWDQLRHNLDTFIPVPLVDDDRSGLTWKQAVSEHSNNWNTVTSLTKVPYRGDKTKGFSWYANNPAAQLAKINAANIPMYIACGWRDIFIADTLLWYKNYNAPKKMMIGPWAHNDNGAPSAITKERHRLMNTEELRFFDYWLKGIDNGIMDQPAIHYATLSDPKQHTWHSSKQWPPKHITDKIDYLSKGKLTQKPPSARGSDPYQTDYTTTTGKASRWNNAVGASVLQYGNMAANDKKSLTYTTHRLKKDKVITGFPVITAYITATTRDYDLHVVLEDVDQQNKSHYVTEGVLRASHRKLSKAPWHNLGLPYQRHSKKDRKYLRPGKMAKLAFYLLPTSWNFKKGHRIRLAIMGADANNTKALIFRKTPNIRLFHRSTVQLPIQKTH